MNQFKAIELRHHGATAAVTPHGAHVTHYQPAGQRPVLWMSDLALFQDGKAIRGGIPVIWPWFGSHPTDSDQASHGVARRMGWQVLGVTESAAKFMLLPEGEHVHPKVDGSFVVTLDLILDEALTVNLTTTNVGKTRFHMTAALHSYFRVADVAQIELRGLDGRTYIDQLDGDQRKVQPGAITINQEVDRIYVDSADTVEIVDPVWGRTIEVAKEGSLSTVVWNPWIDKSKRMADFGDDEYVGMVCVETTNAADDGRTLEPGESHQLVTKIASRLH